MAGASNAIPELESRIAYVRAAIAQTPAAGDADRSRLQDIAGRLAEASVAVNGDATIGGRNEPTPMSISERAGRIYGILAFSQSPVGGLFEESYEIAATEFAAALSALRTIDRDLAALEKALDVKGAPWTPGRIPDWSAN